MMELRILVVDDEEIIRTGISSKITRLFPGKAVVSLAQDAVDALEKLDSFKPDIIITDIRMPEMDGLQLIERAKKLNDSLKFIVVSGYQDFDYARNALRLGVDDYLLKPIENEQLKEIIQKLAELLQKYNTDKLLLDDIKQKAKKGTDFLKNKYLGDLISSANDFDKTQTLKNLELLNIVFPHKYYTVLTILLTTNEELPLLRQEAAVITEELLASLGVVAAFEPISEDRKIAAILNHPHNADALKTQELSDLCTGIIEGINHNPAVKASIGIGSSCSMVEDLYYSYVESCTAAMQRITMGDNHVISIDRIPDCNRIDFLLPDESKMQLVHYIKDANHKLALEIIDKIFGRIKQKKLTYSNIWLIYMDLLLLFNKTIKEMGGSWDKMFKGDVVSEAGLQQYPTLEALYDWVSECVATLCSFDSLNKSLGRKVVDEIKEHINHYYYTEISLTDLACKYYLNPNYLSQLFKSDTNENFVDYLTKVRLEKARELLRHTDLKSYKVAEMVGYNNPRYFSEVFQKYFNITPTEFRKSIQKSQS